ncbi:hypothetical protein BKD30_01560 [Tersicoccus phoenicis]|uniref:DUF3817 domain-containing protein n=1 Tax=Tersicoccus phoenicis TaxID=554083 RepID=A0A1R1LL36_9MICC|nr:DUF3817 domain-containing protein [Tersicoccus phoenicis]OMH28242.1 hypothetical protein BKD30_01560 [Tersicoccus phoenicis]
MSPRTLFRRLALIEAVTWTLLLIGMVLKYVTGTTDLGVRIGGGLHGLAFLSYVAATVYVAVDGRWSAGRTALGLVSAVVPYATLPFERSAERRGLLADAWRLRPGGDAPRTALERLLGLTLRRPALTAVVGVVVVLAVFTALLVVGPPVPSS